MRQYKQAMKHFMIAANAGYEDSLKFVSEGYKTGWVTKDEYESTLRAHKDSLDEMKSGQRAEAEFIRAQLVVTRRDENETILRGYTYFIDEMKSDKRTKDEARLV